MLTLPPPKKNYDLQHYKGDISELELYFVIVNNEYGEQTEEELLPGGKNLRVTNENVITFIHLVANHRLNFQVVQVFILSHSYSVYLHCANMTWRNKTGSICFIGFS